MVAARKANNAYTFVNTEASDAIGRMSVAPGRKYKVALDAFYTVFKAGGLTNARVDHIHYLGWPLRIDNYKNIVDTSLTLTETNTNTHTPGKGMTGVSGAYLNLVVPASLVKSVQNSSTTIVWVEAEEEASSKILLGTTGGSISRVNLNPKNATHHVAGKLNGTAVQAATDFIHNRQGMTAMTRSGTAVSLYRDKTKVWTGTEASSTPSSQTGVITLFRDLGPIYSADQVGFWITGDFFSEAEIGVIHNAILAFRNAILATNWDFETVSPKRAFTPPTQSSPSTLALLTTTQIVSSGTYNTSTDVNLTPNVAARTGRLIMRGGRHVRMHGGRQSITDETGTVATFVVNAQSSISVEGVHFDLNTRTEEADALVAGGTSRFALPFTQFPDVIIQNVLIEGVHGTIATVHGDMIQGDYSFNHLYVDGFTGDSSYQGFFLDQVATFQNGFDIRRANFKRNVRGTPEAQDSVNFLYFADNDAILTATPYPIKLTDVWIEYDGSNALTQVKPNSAAALGSDAISSYIHWPTHTSFMIDCYSRPAKVRYNTTGIPPRGDFVTSALAGLSYTSPGYQ